MRIIKNLSLLALFYVGIISSTQAADLKVGFIYVNPVGENTGWDYQHDQGRKAVEAAYGARKVSQV